MLVPHLKPHHHLRSISKGTVIVIDLGNRLIGKDRFIVAHYDQDWRLRR